MGDKKTKEIVERDKWLLQRARGITSTFAELVDAMGGGEKGTHRAKKIVDQSPNVLQSGDVLPDLGPVLGPPGFCCLPVTCSGAPRAELAACSDRTKAQERRERAGCVAY
jgi:hypothetical protein